MNTYRWCCSVIKSGLTLCDPIDCSIPSFPVLHLSPGVCSNSGPLSQWCYPIISSSVPPFSSCLQSFPASESFPMSQFFSSSDQITGASASASALLTDIQDWLVQSQCRPKDSRVFSSTTVQKHQFFSTQTSLRSNSYICIPIHNY